MQEPLPRMIELARGHVNALHVLSSSGEFTSAELTEYVPEVRAHLMGTPIDWLRQGVVS